MQMHVRDVIGDKKKHRQMHISKLKMQKQCFLSTVSNLQYLWMCGTSWEEYNEVDVIFWMETCTFKHSNVKWNVLLNLIFVSVCSLCDCVLHYKMQSQ